MNRSDQYETFMKDVFEHGVEKSDRTGVGTRSMFGYQMRFNLQEGFPLVTTKKLHLRSIIHELLWFLHGDSNVKYLHDNKVTIWDEWADANGDLGPIYGVQWRHWKTSEGGYVDQISNLIHQIKTNPTPVDWSSLPGMSERLTRWHSRLAICSSNSMWLRESCPASSIREAAISSSEFRLILRAIRCSRT